MRSAVFSEVKEITWTDEELEDPRIQKLVLHGTRRWKCVDCKKEIITDKIPKACLHYHKMSTYITYLVFEN